MPTPNDKPTPLRELLGMDAAPTTREQHHDEPSQQHQQQQRPRALVDGSNVAHAGEGSRARLANILLVRDKLAEQGFEPIVVVDAALRHQIDDPDGYERLVDVGDVKQAPAGTDADYFLLTFAKELDASIVSNDQFRDRSRQFAEVRRRVIRFMILEDEVVFEKRTKKRKS
jgi:hypothetical protein